LPTGLTFISATSSQGNYSTTTGKWDIGSLASTSTATLRIDSKVDTGRAGQKITNTATVIGGQTDPNSLNNTSSVDVTVNNPKCTTNCGGGSGCSTNCGGGIGSGCTINCGGGNPGGNGPIVGSIGGGGNGPILPNNPGPVITNTDNSCYYLRDYLRRDWNNNPVEVKKLQIFLRDLEGFSGLAVTGVYDEPTITATDIFQLRYKEDVLLPWGYDGVVGTDFVYILTKKKVNEIYCKRAFPVTALEQSEIDANKIFFESLKAQGIDVNHPVGVYPVGYTNGSNSGSNGGTTGGNINGNINSGSNSTSTTSTSTIDYVKDLIGSTSSSTKNFFAKIGDGISSVSGRAGSIAVALFAWPFGKSISKSMGNASSILANNFVFWIVLVLALAIIVLMFYWYRERRENKKIEDINKEIDLK
jgi:hypothetical protein